LDNDVFNGTSITGLRSSNIVVNGSQGVLVTFPSFQPGKVSTTVCRSDNTANGAACSAAGAGFRLVGNTFLDNGGVFPPASVPLQATGYSTAFGTAGMETPQVALTGGGFASTLNGSFTANRAQSFPDNSGVVPVTGYINTAYDNFNRANGAIGSSYNVT